MTSINLNSHQRDRALGVILASAAGDALGAPYEFHPPIADTEDIVMAGGGSFGWEPGEWTDDTSMAIVILEAMSKGDALADEATLDQIVEGWRYWCKDAKDAGLQTRRVLAQLDVATAKNVLQISRELHERTGHTAGNGSLMRTGPVGIATLESAEQTAINARTISTLTHFDQDAGDACVLWCLAIRHTVLNGELDIRVGLPHLDEAAQQRWAGLILEAEQNEPKYFAKNGWVIHAFQAAWSAIHKVMNVASEELDFEADRLRLGLEFAIRAGYDTDTVAAIAGSLLGARYGSTAVPAAWRLKMHGWPGITEKQLGAMTYLALNGGAPDSQGWPGVSKFDYSDFPERFELVNHPHDAGLWLGGVDSLANLPSSVTAVVSLCRVGNGEVPLQIAESVEILLIDSASPTKNMNLAFTFADTASAIKQLRDRGHEVFLHCVQSQSRTPSVAITYSVNELGIDFEKANQDVLAALPAAQINGGFQALLEELRG